MESRTYWFNNFEIFPILDFKRWNVEMSINVDCFYHSKQRRHLWNAILGGISPGSSLFAKVSVNWYPEWNELMGCKLFSIAVKYFRLLIYISDSIYGRDVHISLH